MWQIGKTGTEKSNTLFQQETTNINCCLPQQIESAKIVELGTPWDLPPQMTEDQLSSCQLSENLFASRAFPVLEIQSVTTQICEFSSGSGLEQKSADKFISQDKQMHHTAFRLTLPAIRLALLQPYCTVLHHALLIRLLIPASTRHAPCHAIRSQSISSDETEALFFNEPLQ